MELNTANDEVAIHEFAHAWWEELRKDPKIRRGLVQDTIKLSNLEDKNYSQAIKMAGWIVTNFCYCNDLGKINYNSVDDHHFYANLAEFTMGRFKDGERKLPSFMWLYLDGLFTGNPKVKPCYETGNCYFNFSLN